ncbi:hypothetical protein J6590_029698 [Homalodisca vitripennis]|nr:hypothetical protein J6590_029698 [Homalodisca vitripennis]
MRKVNVPGLATWLLEITDITDIEVVNLLANLLAILTAAAYTAGLELQTVHSWVFVLRNYPIFRFAAPSPLSRGLWQWREMLTSTPQVSAGHSENINLDMNNTFQPFQFDVNPSF